MSENIREKKTDNRIQKSEDRGQMAEGIGHKVSGVSGPLAASARLIE